MVLLYKDLENGSKDSLKEMAKESIKHFEESFNKEGFTNENGTRRRWKKRVYTIGRKNRKTLEMTGRMSKAFTSKITQNKAFIVNNAEYSGYHNEGAESTVTAKQIAYFEFRAQSAIRSDDQRFWSNIASKRVGSKIILPQRQFMGESKTLVNKHLRTISRVLNSKIKKNSVNSIVKL